MKIERLKNKFLVILFLAVVVAIVVLCIVNRLESNAVYTFKTKERIPDIKILDIDGKESTLASYCQKSKKEKTLAIYLSMKCESCLNLLDTINMLGNFDTTDIQVLAMWEGDIPLQLLEEGQVEGSLNLSMVDGKINEIVKPYCYLIDNSSLILEEKTEYIEAAIKSIYKDRYSKEDVKKYFTKYFSQKYLLYSDTYCEGCNEFYENIEEN